MTDEDRERFSQMKFIREGQGADIARLQERVRMMEATVGEFRGDLKEIKISLQLSNGLMVKDQGSRQTWGLLLTPAINMFWGLVGAALMWAFSLHH